MKKLAVLLAFLIIPNLTGGDQIRGRQVTITAGTAIRVVANDVRADSILFQMKHGGTGLGYVLSADSDVTCANGGAGTTLVGELSPATATAPGGSLSHPSNGAAATSQGGVNVRIFCVDGTVNGDIMIVSWSPR